MDSQWGNKEKLAAQRKIGVLICQKTTDWQEVLCASILLSECGVPHKREQTRVHCLCQTRGPMWSSQASNMLPPGPSENN